MEKYTTFKHAFTVTENDTGKYLGAGGLPLLSTPAMISYMEKTAYLMLKGPLDSEHSKDTTVGIEMNIKHLAPAAIGNEVIIKVTLLEETARKYTLKVEAFVAGKLIGEGTHKRALVDPEKFMEKAK